MNKILFKVQCYYRELFNEKKIDANFMNDALNKIERVLENNSQSFLLQSIPEKEILDTINSFNLGKVPGSDGLPIEFYKVFYEVLKDDLLSLFTDVFNTKILPQSWKMVNFNKCEILKVGKLDTRDIKKDLSWSCIHSCLPCRAFQHRRGFASTAKCPREGCHEEETVLHLLWTCDFSRRIWTKMLPLLNKIAAIKDLDYNMVLYGCLDCPGEQEKRKAWQIINCVKAALWKNRNILLFKKDILSFDDVIGMILSEMYIYLLIDKQSDEFAFIKWHFTDWHM
ncbi:uncharacterized protein LOC130328351 [Hyla sarda]|uniref:uncharacterized protein LOC130328351 n=1 Tax=Hyla sarda TaxID=327740 RepID=UPI0024C30FB5|nr:uncharacterized protein LOC130328351 [Hyla sarda]